MYIMILELEGQVQAERTVMSEVTTGPGMSGTCPRVMLFKEQQMKLNHPQMAEKFDSQAGACHIAMVRS